MGPLIALVFNSCSSLYGLHQWFSNTMGRDLRVCVCVWGELPLALREEQQAVIELPGINSPEGYPLRGQSRLG